MQWRPRDPKMECQMCRMRFHRSELKKNWKGQLVCLWDYETKHPQDTLRTRPPEKPPHDWVPVQTEFTELDQCTVAGRSARPGYAIPGCSIPGNNAVVA